MARVLAVPDLHKALAKDGDFDAVVLVASHLDAVDQPQLQAAMQAGRAMDEKLDDHVSLLPAPELAGGRLVLAPTGPCNRDHDDVRRFADAAVAGVRRARDAGADKPLLVVAGVPPIAEFVHALPVCGVAALGALWEPLEAREALGEECEPVAAVGLASETGPVGQELADWVAAVDGGARVTRDLCGTEPERMAPPRFAEYCQEAFAGLPVKVEVEADPETLEREYPLLAAVARASMPVDRHQPRVIKLEYQGEGPTHTTLLLAGKGVVYDTGGADLKTGGGMAGMSRDKGGAAAVAGFVHAVAALKPKGVRVIAELGAVRNSIGAEAYVADEILTSHAGVRVRIGNTDAEGRLVLADLLSHLRERALKENEPRLFTVATLTGHAVRAAGPYSIALDNGPARALGIAQALAAEGEQWGDPFEVSRLRREDWDFIKPRTKADDVLSCNNGPSTATNRGHQFPMAFLALASGLDKHGRDGDPPLAFTHIDIAGSATEGGDWQHGRPTGRPVVALLTALVEGILPV